MQQNNLETASVGRLLVSLSIPMICAQLVTLLYNVVDRMFIGKMENGAMAILRCFRPSKKEPALHERQALSIISLPP